MDVKKFLEGESFLKSYKDLVGNAAVPIDNVRERITSQFDSLPESIQNAMTEKQFLEMIAKTIDTLIKELEAATKLNLNKAQHSHKLNHKFSWPLPLDISAEDLEKYMLIKGAAMTAGEMKRGEIMTDHNVIFGAGAMSTGAQMGVVMIDIDHYDKGLPKDKYSKHDVAKINETYPPAFIIDAAAEKNLIQPENEERMQVEFIGACQNRYVYNMIKEGKFKGCSVVDYYRKESCDSCDGKDGKCNCTIEGSHFLTNTLILEEVPNSNATWVDVVSESDIGTIIEKPSASKLKMMKNSASKETTANRYKLNLLLQNVKNYAEGDLDKYKEDGNWLNGEQSIVSFLVEEKSIPQAKAEDMAKFIFENPDLLNDYQLEWLSAEDLVAWFDHITQKMINAKINQLQKQITALATLKHNATPLDQLKHFVPFGQSEVNYGDRDSGKCNGCRYFFGYDMEDLENTMGGCAIVVGDVFGQQGCDKFEANPNASGGETTDDPIDAPEDNADGDPIPDEEGNCPDGWHANEDGTACIKDEEENADEIPVPDADGNCPDGWHASEDGTECIKDESEENMTVGKKRMQMILGVNAHSITPTVAIESQGMQKTSKQSVKLDAEIEKLELKLKSLGKSIFGKGKDSMVKQAEYNKIKNEIKRLRNLKKN